MRPARDTPHGKRLLLYLREVELGTQEAIEEEIRRLARLSTRCEVVRDQIDSLRHDHKNLLEKGYTATEFSDGKVWYFKEDDSQEELVLTHIDKSILKQLNPGGTWGIMPQEGLEPKPSESIRQMMDSLKKDDSEEVTPNDIPASYSVRPSKRLRRNK